MEKMITIPYEEYLELTGGKVKIEENIKKYYESLIKEDEDKKKKEKLLKIINHYGVIPQLKYFQSEVFELNEAIINHEWLKSERGTENISHIAEEIADVMVMLNQFMMYYNISNEEVRDIMISKVNRQLERIEKEGKE